VASPRLAQRPYSPSFSMMSSMVVGCLKCSSCFCFFHLASLRRAICASSCASTSPRSRCSSSLPASALPLPPPRASFSCCGAQGAQVDCVIQFCRYQSNPGTGWLGPAPRGSQSKTYCQGRRPKRRLWFTF
jgi:hypothetical protein